MILSISWKNVWRSRTRSLVVIGAVTLGTIAGVFTAGLVKGWIEERIHSAIYNEVSHVKIYNPDFLNNEELGYTLDARNVLETAIDDDERVFAYSSRLKLMAMANTSRGTTGLMMNGIDVEKEVKVSEIHHHIVAGDYLGTSKKNQIVLSDNSAEQLRLKYYTITNDVITALKEKEISDLVLQKLGKMEGQRFYTDKLFKKALKSKLKASEIKKYGATILKTAVSYRLNSKVVLTFSDAENNLVYGSFRLAGVYKTTNTTFDGMNGFVSKSDLIPLISFNGNECHEIAILLHDIKDSKAVANDILTRNDNLAVLTWKNLAPDVALMSDFMVIWYYVVIGFILFALAFGIINTMLMAILERVKELGMLMAIGMNKKRVFRMIMLETIILTLVGAFFGMVIGAFLIGITGYTGINLSSVGEGFEAMGFAAIVYPEIEWYFFIGVTLMVIITGVLSSIIPAKKALKLNPVEALRTE